MSVEFTIVPLPLEPQEVRFGRLLTNDEMITLTEVVNSKECKKLLAEGERYQRVVVSREAARWFGKDSAANKAMIGVVEAYAANLPEAAHEPHPEQLLYGTDGSLSLQPQ